MRIRKTDLWHQLRRIEQLIEASDLDAALKLLVEVEADAARLDIESAHLVWLRAIIEDHRGEHEAALRSIQFAINLDPVAPPYRHSFQVIVSHVRTALAEKRGPSELAPVPKLWELLVRAGEADDSVHLALVRHYIVSGSPEEALRILNAVTTLSPANVEAWSLLVLVATEMDLPEMVAEARAEAAALGARPVAFVMPAEAEG